MTTLSQRGLDLTNICIYATGSYGRREASAASDVDLFIVDAIRVDEQGKDERSLSNVEQIRLKAALIEVCNDELGLPEFDGDGRFLDVHPFGKILEALGGTRDDALNYFTARLLLLLESQVVFNAGTYRSVVEGFLGAYYRDFSGHETNFLPAYLVNDIVRYWKTLTLNYEHARRMDEEHPTTSLAKIKAKHRLKNLKLSFSRIMTCYSALVSLAHAASKGVVLVEEVESLVYRSPVERLEALRSEEELTEIVDQVLEGYAWFLANLGGEKSEAFEYLADADRLRDARNRAYEYRTNFHRLLLAAGERGRLVTYVTM